MPDTASILTQLNMRRLGYTSFHPFIQSFIQTFIKCSNPPVWVLNQQHQNHLRASQEGKFSGLPKTYQLKKKKRVCARACECPVAVQHWLGPRCSRARSGLRTADQGGLCDRHPTTSSLPSWSPKAPGLDRSRAFLGTTRVHLGSIWPRKRPHSLSNFPEAGPRGLRPPQKLDGREGLNPSLLQKLLEKGFQGREHPKDTLSW